MQAYHYKLIVITLFFIRNDYPPSCTTGKPLETIIMKNNPMKITKTTGEFL
jgi:hypothetical protein